MAKFDALKTVNNILSGSGIAALEAALVNVGNVIKTTADRERLPDVAVANLRDCRVLGMCSK